MGYTVIKHFWEESHEGRYWRAEQRKEKYIELVKDGMGFIEIRDELKVKDSALIKYALETNMIPSVSKKKSDFDRNLMYHCIKEHNEVKEEKREIREEINAQKAERDKYRWDPDWAIR